MGPRAVSHFKLLIPKLYFEAKTPVFTPLQYVVPMLLLRLEYIYFGPSACGPVNLGIELPFLLQYTSDLLQNKFQYEHEVLQ